MISNSAKDMSSIYHQTVTQTNFDLFAIYNFRSLTKMVQVGISVLILGTLSHICMHQRKGSLLVQVMAWHLFGVNPLTEPML